MPTFAQACLTALGLHRHLAEDGARLATPPSFSSRRAAAADWCTHVWCGYDEALHRRFDRAVTGGSSISRPLLLNYIEEAKARAEAHEVELEALDFERDSQVAAIYRAYGERAAFATMQRGEHEVRISMATKLLPPEERP